VDADEDLAAPARRHLTLDEPEAAALSHRSAITRIADIRRPVKGLELLDAARF
jgi:hypothetical protein